MNRIGKLFLAGASACGMLLALFLTAQAFPTPPPDWLGMNGTGDSQTASDYYSGLQASGIVVPSTFSAWLQAYGFSNGDEARAIYYNAGDLGLGRDMHCRRNGADVACYVINYGFSAGASKEFALDAAIHGQSPVAVVAMVYTSSLAGGPNAVSFFIYGDGQNLQPRNDWALLDTQGQKFLPYLCIHCHGGLYDFTDRSITGASFLPFDTSSFQYSTRPGFTLAHQQEEFRKLNALVRDTNPSTQITQLIDGWYNGTGGVYQPGSHPNHGFVPPDYHTNPDDEQLYLQAVKPYCRTCHIFQAGGLASSPASLSSLARSYVFSGYIMPHSEKTNRDFWRGLAPAILASKRGWSLRVTRQDDPPPDGCVAGDCSLREAIIAANETTGKDIITFDFEGQIVLETPGEDDMAWGGDLDITDDLILLGNGASRTLIVDGQQDRIFHILNGSNVVIQGVTIDGGDSWKGGGIYNEAGNLTVNSSILRNNTADAGGGLATSDATYTEVNESAIYENHATEGGGVANSGGALRVTNTSISWNIASGSGGGLHSAPGLSEAADSIIIHNTIAFNQAETGGGIFTDASAVTIKNSIIAGNEAGFSDVADCASNSGDAYTPLGVNLVGQYGWPSGCQPSDLVLPGSIDTVIEVNLRTQKGEVPSHPLVEGSPAIDAIDVDIAQDICGLSAIADLHNIARPLDGDWNGSYGCDAGAVEYAPNRLIFLPLVVR